MRLEIVKAIQILEDVLSSEDLPYEHRRALFQVKKLLVEAQDSMVVAKSKTRDIAYTLGELAKALGLEIKIGAPRLSLVDEEVAEMLRESMVAELEVGEEEAIVEKVVAPPQ